MQREIDNPLLPRPRRSCLYIPGANARGLEKAKSLPADMLILDLDDAVAPDAKTGAREAVRSVVGDRAYGAREVVIRINGLDTCLLYTSPSPRD